MTDEDVLRERGLRVVVDTTRAAEMDIAALGLSERQVQFLARRIANAPYLPDDQSVGQMTVRRITDLDIAFVP